MEIIFIRHSKTEIDPQVPISNWGLSEEGVELAKRFSTNESVQQLDVLYTSFQTKALETAVLLAKPNGIPIKADNGLTEVSSFTGPFEPNFEQYEQGVKDYYAKKIERISNGESIDEAVERFNRTLLSIVAAEQGKNKIGIITHANIVTLFSSQYMDIDCYNTHMAIKQPDIAIFEWENKKFRAFFGEVI